MNLTIKRLFEAKGWIEPPPQWSLDVIEAAILLFFKEHGRRPLKSNSDKQWAHLDHWLRRHQGQTLRQCCDALGLPTPRNEKRTLDQVTVEILSHYQDHGIRPTVKTSKEWSRWCSWLHRHHGLSLSKLCDNLGLPAVRNNHRTMAAAKRVVLAYHKEHGTRPKTKSSDEMNRWAIWLRQHGGTSLAGLCDKLGLPSDNLGAEERLEKIGTEIRVYFTKHGRRPSQLSNEHWKKTDTWLRKCGSSLSQVCRGLGLPSWNLSRSWETIEAEVGAYFDEHGTRPMATTNTEWRACNKWLGRRGSSLASFCSKQLNLPTSPRTNPNRSRNTIKAALLNYHAEHGIRPNAKTNKEWNRRDQWLRRKGSSLSLLCNTMNIPGRYWKVA
jgi:hypothetical protein